MISKNVYFMMDTSLWFFVILVKSVTQVPRLFRKVKWPEVISFCTYPALVKDFALLAIVNGISYQIKNEVSTKGTPSYCQHTAISYPTHLHTELKNI